LTGCWFPIAQWRCDERQTLAKESAEEERRRGSEPLEKRTKALLRNSRQLPRNLAADSSEGLRLTAQELGLLFSLGQIKNAWWIMHSSL
jgi:hypothetical protein